MKETKTIKVIIPVHELNEKTTELFKRALKSVETQKSSRPTVLVVTSSAVKAEVDTILETFNKTVDPNGELKEATFTSIVNDGKTDFCSQVNFGAQNCGTDYFSILEFDDEYSTIWFKAVNEYVEAYPETGVFLPIIVETDVDGNFIHFTNEAAWAQGFGEKMGQLDIGALLNFPNFGTSGSVFKTERFNEIGGFKPDMKLTFMYEFLLRGVNEDLGTMIIPRIGYKHTNLREGSLFMTYRDPVTGIKPKEAKHYMDMAKQEYFFSPLLVKRDVTYKETV